MTKLSAVLAAALACASVVSAKETVTVTKTIEKIYKTKTKTETKYKTVTASATCSAVAAPTSYWPGWAGLSYLVTFGDSYSTTGFNDTLTQPNAANPLGNPAYPGYTATNGPNWVDFLTTTYNQSFLETVNLAYGGATVDSALVVPYLPTVLSLKEQVQDEYLPVYADHPSFFDWSSNNTLFGTFIGINDVGNSYSSANSTLYDMIFAEYAGLQEQLYQSGARNFLFLNVPPVNRSPGTLIYGNATVELEGEVIAAWNANVTKLANNLTATYSDATAFVFDTNAIFTQVLDDVCSHPQTCQYKNTTGYCTYCKLITSI